MSEVEDVISSFLSKENSHDPSAWSTACPELTISKNTKASNGASSQKIKIDEASSERKRQKLVSHGYSLVEEKFDMDLIGSLRKGIEQLFHLGLPATFILLFDEAWDLARSSRTALEQCTHTKNQLNFDLLAWYIKPGASGFSVRPPIGNSRDMDYISTFLLTLELATQGPSARKRQRYVSQRWPSKVCYAVDCIVRCNN